MVDPGSILTVLELTVAVVQYLNNVKGAPKECKKVLAEVSSASGILLILRDLAERSGDGTWSPTLKSVSQPNGPLDQYRIALERLTSKLLPSESWRKASRAWAWPFQKEEVMEVLAMMERQKSLFILALQNDQLGLSQAIKLDIARLHVGLLNINEKIDKIQADHETHLEDQASQEILNWLCSLDFSVKHNDLKARRQEGTGTWLLKSEQFTKWVHGTNETLLCPGIPGAGKTMLASIVVDYLVENVHGQNDDVGIAYLYCDYKTRHEQTPIALLESFLKQFISRHGTISENVRQLYELHSRRKTRPSFREVCQMLSHEIKRHTRVFIVVDALDECSEDDGNRRTLVSQLKALQENCNINLLITSRFILNTTQEWMHAAQLEIRASDEDVQRYIEGQVFRLARCVTRNKSLQEAIEDSVIQAVGGMFLLAQLHIDSLVDKTSPKAIKNALLQLPRGSEALDLAYSEAVERINGQKPGFKDLAKQVLSWITTTQRPLSVQELQHAIAIEPQTVALDHDNISDIEEMLSACAGLVVVDQESNIVRLVHYTTQEYLERIRPVYFPDAQRNIYASCITCLSYSVFLDGYSLNDKDFEARLQQDPFLDYAAQYWGFHARDSDQEIHNLTLAFLTNNAKVSCASQVMLARSSSYGEYSQIPPKLVSGMHLAAYFGLDTFIAALLNPKSIDAKDSNGRTPLMWAMRGEHEGSVRLLLEKGADLNQKCRGWDITALHNAAWCGNEAIMKLLVANGADINAMDDDDDEKPLLQALGQVHYGKPRLLLEEKAESMMEHYDGCAVIHQAAGSGNETVMLLLLKLGANTGIKTREYGSTALHVAAELGHENVVRMLLDHGADVSTPSHEHAQTALHLAAACGHEAVTRLLLDRGANPEARSEGNGYTALQLAAHNGHEAVVRVLLEKGADAAAKTYYEEETALDLAVNMDRMETAALLQAVKE